MEGNFPCQNFLDIVIPQKRPLFFQLALIVGQDFHYQMIFVGVIIIITAVPFDIMDDLFHRFIIPSGKIKDDEQPCYHTLSA